MEVPAKDKRSARPVSTWALRIMLLLSPLAGVWLVSGCNPASMAMLLMPFVDDKEPAKCKLSTAGKDTTVAIVTWFGNRELQLYPELMPTDNELSEKLAAILRDRFAANREKIKIVPNAQVRTFQNKVFSDTYSPADLGKQVKADKVIALEINALSLHEKSSYNQLFRGNAEILVSVYDVAKPAGEQVIYGPEVYRGVFPKDAPLADGSSLQFRAAFITRVARDLSRLFAAHSSDERMYNMPTD